MIDLSRSTTSSPDVHTVPSDPGVRWIKDETPVIDAPPDDDVDPLPEARWETDANRTGICGSVAPRVLKLPDGTYRMYYTQMVPRPGHPAGANDYDNVSTRILSATSSDGLVWTPERGVRLTPQDGARGGVACRLIRSRPHARRPSQDVLRVRAGAPDRIQHT